jgi:predicted ATP-dependent endonuclease of OLD family
MSNDAIATITVRNYRCFGDQGATFELRPGFTAFVGPNNSGKSILLRIC